MTRKRYVKLLMSRGFSRNEANAVAQRALQIQGSYSAAAKYIRPKIKFVVEGLEEFQDALFQDALFRVSASMEDLARAVQELCASGKPAPQSQRYVELEDNNSADNHDSC